MVFDHYSSAAKKTGGSGTIRRFIAPLCCAAVALSLPTTVYAQVEAGTVITNTASLRVTLAGTGDRTIDSNAATLTVAEILDVALVRTAGASAPVAVDATGAVVPVTVTNRGNGREAFTIAATPSDGSLVVKSIAIDVDGDGRFDPAHDSVLVAGTTSPLAAGATLALLVVLDRPTATPTATALTVTATAATGSGAPGTVFAGRGDGGGDAVTGSTSAAAQLVVPLAAADAAAPTLTKTQSVLAPDGSATAVRGAVVTYTLVARFGGRTDDARIRDAVPAGTVYVPGTLRVDAVALSDAADTDAGGFDGTAIAVTLGDIAAAATRTVQFQVRIQ